MLLRELVIENVGLFRGENRFDLSPVGDRPIVLVGGKNGAGKTTFLDSLRLCLYGPLATGSRVSRADYQQYLDSRIHRVGGDAMQPSKARIKITFEHAAQGERHTFEVARRWERTRSGSILEALEVFRDGTPLEDLHEAHWEDFVEDLVPLGVSQLFFFDGEKIKSLADEQSGMDHLAQSMKSMLGLDLVERLRADLSLLRDRSLKSGGPGKLREELASAEQGVAALNTRLESIDQEVEALDVQRLSAASGLRLSEDDLRRKGGRFAEQRDQLKEEQAALEGRLKHLEDEARRMTEGSLPFAFCPNLCERLLAQLDGEAEAQRATILRDHLQKVAVQTAELIETDGGLQSSERSRLAGRVRDLISGYTRGQVKEIPLIHRVSEIEAASITATIDDALGPVRDQAQRIAKQLEGTTSELRRVRLALDQAPKVEVLQDALDQVVGMRTRHAEIEAKQADLAMQRAEAVRLRDQRGREVARIKEKLAAEAQSEQRLATMQKTIQAMADYQGRLTVAKLRVLERRIAERFQVLARKEELVHQVKVDPVSFEVMLVDADGRNLDRRELSAGEKQIYAIATLWGLADTSGRPLPTVIDTPLGRLDSDHRHNLIQKYFPSVSHQVIILSTDTEVDKALYDELTPYLSRAYLLEVRSGEGCTSICETYFWQRSEE